MLNSERVKELITKLNDFEIEESIAFFSENARVVDRPEKMEYKGHEEIRTFFKETYVALRLNTQVYHHWSASNQEKVKVVVRGNFPGKNLNGSYTFTFENQKIVQWIIDID